MVGPALGYVIGGQFLEMYVDFDRISEIPSISSKDPNWIGAWWLGFVFAWALSWMCAIFLFCYPATLPKTEKSFSRHVSASDHITEKYAKDYRAKEPLNFPSVNNTEAEMVLNGESSIRNTVKEASTRILQLFKNPSYILLCIGGALDSIMIIGLATFMPKFIMSQYGFTASFSAIIIGIIITPSGGLGTLTGGYLVKRFKMNREQILKMYIYSQFVAIPCLFAFVCYCNDAKFAGVNVPYNTTIQNSGLSVNLSAECNVGCGECGGVNKYEPVCGDNGYIYLNSCYAGCKEFTDTNNSTTYTKCSCIKQQEEDYGGGRGSNQMEMCNVECEVYFYLFVLILFLIIWFSLMSGMPCIACIMRFVEPENKSLSMGIAFIIARYVY